MVATSQPDAVVEAVGLTKTFKDFWGRPKARAVNGINFTVRKGQVFGLLGPNGSGKSTTVKLILGLLYPTRGNLSVFGESPRNVDIKRRIGYLPEESYLYRYLTAAETLDFFGALFSLPESERRRRTAQLLEMVGLTNSRNRPVGEFSKGMSRRIGLAQALINDPSLIILDEPTSGLDPIGCREVKDVIRLLASRGKTVILCSHLLADVEDVCDEVVILYGGKIRAQGGLQEILTVEDRTRVLLPDLGPEHMAETIDFITAKFGADRVQVDKPTMNLEDFFLEVVRKAREASVETAGAQAGGQIAAYLQEDAEPEDASKRVLAALTRETAPLPTAPETAKPELKPRTEPERPRVDENKLRQLADNAPETANRDDARASKPETEPELSQRIQDVLKKTDPKP